MASLSSRRATATYRQIAADGLTAVPNASTSLSTTLSHVFQVVFCNPTGGSVTFTLTATDTSVYLINSAIAAGTTFVAAFPEGVALTGVKWGASATGCFGEVYGFKKET